MSELARWVLLGLSGLGIAGLGFADPAPGSASPSEQSSPVDVGLLSTMVDGDLYIQPCRSSVGDPNLTCPIVVFDPEQSMTAQVEGPPGCRQPLVLPGGVGGFVIQYEVAQGANLRFSGTLPECDRPVTEAATCDFGASPFLAIECHQANRDMSRFQACSSCVRMHEAFCYSELTRTSVKLQISNVNDCEAYSAALTFLIAVKAENPTVIDGQDFYRIYLVDPAVIQDVNCPNGC
ncbi:MAG: hypothetical protein AAGC60_18110 [Acidobacteriota bacterium]